jgi:aconitate hydratase
VSLRTNNRNFEGRSGTKDAQVYLVSPETAAVSAVLGVVTDPSTLELAEIAVPAVKRFISDDNLFIFPNSEQNSEEIKRGPNIGEPPKCEPLADRIKAVVGLKVGDKITTDHIMPAGARLKYRSNIAKYSTFVFEPVDPSFPERSMAVKAAGCGTVIVAGQSYGQGSSREHAAICPMYLGVKAVLALSIERIHQANLCNFGILPLTFVDPADYEKLEQGDEILIENAVSQVKSGGFVTVRNVTKGYDFEMKLTASALQRQMLVAGGRLNQIKESLKEA